MLKGANLKGGRPYWPAATGSQLNKPEATSARNQNSIGDRTEKKKYTSYKTLYQQSTILLKINKLVK